MNPFKIFILIMGCAALFLIPGPRSAQAGQDRPATKALADEEIQGLLQGEGLGAAKLAELNHYPGPRHVLDLADQLHLSEAQRARTQKIFDSMHEEAVRLGKLIIEKEQELENLFAGNNVDQNKIKKLLREIARLRGALRITHLQAHLEMKSVLSPEQIVQYDLLRGYAPDTRQIPSHHHKNP